MAIATAAPAEWPYRWHRTMAAVMAVEKRAKETCGKCGQVRQWGCSYSTCPLPTNDIPVPSAPHSCTGSRRNAAHTGVPSAPIDDPLTSNPKGYAAGAVGVTDFHASEVANG